MAAVTSASVLCTVLFLCIPVVFASDVTNIAAVSGENVTLSCLAHRNTDIRVVEWSRKDLETDYVFLSRDNQSDPENQHPLFKNRVELKDKQMKDGDVSLVLNNVTINDTGTYECRVKLRETNRRKRSFLKTDPICRITLSVRDSGGDKDGGNQRGNVGLAVGLSMLVVVVVVVVVCFVMYRKRKGLKEQNSYTDTGEKDTNHQQV